MNIFVPNIIFVETDDDEKQINSSIEDYGLNTKVMVGNNYYHTKQIKTYVVKPLDTYSKISKKMGISEIYLRDKYNNKPLFIGQILSLD